MSNEFVARRLSADEIVQYEESLMADLRFTMSLFELIEREIRFSAETRLLQNKGRTQSLINYIASKEGITRWKSSGGSTLLHHACEKNAYNAVTALILAGADIRAQNKGKSEPLYRAAYNCGYESMKILLEHGACPNSKSQSNQSVLTRVCYKGSPKCAELLLEYGATIEYHEKFKTPLFALLRSANASSNLFQLGRRLALMPHPEVYSPLETLPALMSMLSKISSKKALLGWRDLFDTILTTRNADESSVECSKALVSLTYLRPQAAMSPRVLNDVINHSIHELLVRGGSLEQTDLRSKELKKEAIVSAYQLQNSDVLDQIKAHSQSISLKAGLKKRSVQHVSSGFDDLSL